VGGPGLLLGFGAVPAALVWMDAGPASGFRHLYLVPTLWAALRFGGLGGGSGGLLGALLYAPFVLPAIERDGLAAGGGGGGGGARRPGGGGGGGGGGRGAARDSAARWVVRAGKSLFVSDLES